MVIKAGVLPAAVTCIGLPAWILLLVSTKRAHICLAKSSKLSFTVSSKLFLVLESLYKIVKGINNRNRALYSSDRKGQ